MIRRDKVLMIPGPSEAPIDSLLSMSKPIPPHYSGDWVKLYEETVEMIEKLLYASGEVYILTGSGTSALEAAICSVVEPGDKVIVDEVFKGLVEVYGGKPIDVTPKPGEAISVDEVKKLLEREKVKAVAILHNITWTAVANPIREIGEVVKDYDAVFIIDAISSMGGMEIRMDDWGIDIVCGATQKALSTPPGLAPIAVSEKAWNVIENRREKIRSKYLSLKWYKYPPFNPKVHPTPATCSTTLVVALWNALKLMMEEGFENVFKRHRVVAEAVREAVKEMGFKLLIKDERHASSTVTAVIWPEKYDYSRFWRTLYDKYNLMIGNPPEMLPFHGIPETYFRIGHMGVTASMEYVLPTLGFIEIAARSVGLRIKPGVSVSKALEIMEKYYGVE